MRKRIDMTYTSAHSQVSVGKELTRSKTMNTQGHASRYPIPPYSFETNLDLVRRLEFDDGDLDEITKEISFRERLGGWFSTREEREAAICAVNSAYSANRAARGSL